LQRAAFLLPGTLTFVGAVLLWQSLTTLDYYNADRGAPGSGFLSFWVSLGMILCGVLLTGRALLYPEGEADWPDAAGLRRIAFLLGGFVVFLAAVNVLGFVASSALFLGVTSYLLGMTSLRVLIPVSIVVGIMMQVLFNDLLRISLPVGMLGLDFGKISSWIF
jgi:hypothetical protein